MSKTSCSDHLGARALPLLASVCIFGCMAASLAPALEDADIPTDAPQDALMASPEEVQEMLGWARGAFTGVKPQGSEPAVRVEVRRQDYNVLRFGQSCMETPIKCGEQLFLPLDTVLEPGKPVTLAPVGGRPSNHTFPFFNIQYGDEGVIAAIGWSGQWAARIERAANGPTRVQAGMEKVHLRLHPLERIRGPRILVMPWKGDRMAAHNRIMRRQLRISYQIENRPVLK